MKESEQQHIFTSWLKQYKALLFKIVRAYAFTDDDRDDLFQEISIQVWHSIPRFRQESAVSTWLYSVSLNTALRWISKERKYSESREAFSKDHLPEALLEEQAGFEDERLAWLYKTIAQLKAIDRSIALLLLDGLSYSEMSDLLGLTESNIGVRIFRIKQHLITQSKKYDYHGI